MQFAILPEVSGPWRRREEDSLQDSEGLISDPAFRTPKPLPRNQLHRFTTGLVDLFRFLLKTPAICREQPNMPRLEDSGPPHGFNFTLDMGVKQ